MKTLYIRNFYIFLIQNKFNLRLLCYNMNNKDNLLEEIKC
ncbi:hypothetical protein [Campylobacter phage CJLB-10]|nr:hypothetical protein [Campylobacter phage CJLB-10]